MPRIMRVMDEEFEKVLNGSEILVLAGDDTKCYEGEIINLVVYPYTYRVSPEPLTIKIIKIEKVTLLTLSVRIKIVNSVFELVDEKRAKQNTIERRDYHRNQAKKKIGR